MSPGHVSLCCLAYLHEDKSFHLCHCSNTVIELKRHCDPHTLLTAWLSACSKPPKIQRMVGTLAWWFVPAMLLSLGLHLMSVKDNNTETAQGWPGRAGVWMCWLGWSKIHPLGLKLRLDNRDGPKGEGKKQLILGRGETCPNTNPPWVFNLCAYKMPRNLNSGVLVRPKPVDISCY